MPLNLSLLHVHKILDQFSKIETSRLLCVRFIASTSYPLVHVCETKAVAVGQSVTLRKTPQNASQIVIALC